MCPKIDRWILELQLYDFTFHHRHGIVMGRVDALSRCYDLNERKCQNSVTNILNRMIRNGNTELIAHIDDEDFTLGDAEIECKETNRERRGNFFCADGQPSTAVYNQPIYNYYY